MSVESAPAQDKGVRQKNVAYTLTFGDGAENEVGMEIIRSASNLTDGLSVDQLRRFERHFVAQGAVCKLVDLAELGKGHAQLVPEAGVLVVRKGVNFVRQEPHADAAVFSELEAMPKDTQALRPGGIVYNKTARYNNTMGDYSQEPDIQNGKGTVLDFADWPATGALRSSLSSLLGGIDLVGETNFYHNVDQCGIRFHGDAERKIVIGTRFGPGADGFPLKFVWYEHGHPVGFEGHIELNEGDLYIMSSKAVGFDKRATLRLMHAAGKEKYTIDPKHLRTGQSFPPVLSLRMPWTEWAKGRLPQNGPMDAFLSKRKLIERGGDGDDNADPGCDGNGDGNAGDEVKCVVCDNSDSSICDFNRCDGPCAQWFCIEGGCARMLGIKYDKHLTVGDLLCRACKPDKKMKTTSASSTTVLQLQSSSVQ